MKERSVNGIRIGDRLYEVCMVSDIGKMMLCVIEVTDIKTTYTPTGRPRKPVFIGKPVNFTTGRDHSDAEREINPYRYCQTATKAVTESLRQYFDQKRRGKPLTATERLLNAVFGEKPSPMIAATEIFDVINDLKNYHALFAEAFRIDDERVQKVGVDQSASDATANHESRED